MSLFYRICRGVCYIAAIGVVTIGVAIAGSLTMNYNADLIATAACPMCAAIGVAALPVLLGRFFTRLAQQEKERETEFKRTASRTDHPTRE